MQNLKLIIRKLKYERHSKVHLTCSLQKCQCHKKQRLNETCDPGFSFDIKDNIGTSGEIWMQPEGWIIKLQQF